MANFYWYGGTGNWSEFLTHWSGNSGNSPISPVLNAPTSSDDVFIDSNSGFGGGGTITLDAVSECNDFTSTSGHTYTVTTSGQYVNIFGSLTLEAGVTFDTAWSLVLVATSGGKTITIGGATITNIQIGGDGGITGGGWALQDNLVLAGEFYIQNGTFDANDHNVTANDFYFYADTGFTPTVVMGSGTWEATGEASVWGVDQYSGEHVTIVPETSTIKLSNSGISDVGFYTSDDPLTNSDGNGIYNNLWCSGNPLSFKITYGNNTFNDFKVSAPNTVQFKQGTTTTVSSFAVSGTAGNLITLNSNNGVDQFTLSKSSGVVSCDYLDISDSNAEGGAVWNAGLHSVNTTNNTGWLFPRNLYWVNGTGNWSDTGQWALTSGDTGAGADIPTLVDNVFIDDQSGLSGETITLDVLAKCNDITCTSGFTYTIDATSNTLQVLGSPTFEAGLTINGTDSVTDIQFGTNSPGTLFTSGGATFNIQLTFGGIAGAGGIGGSWILQDNLVIESTGYFYQENGTFDANNHNVTAKYFYFVADIGYTPTTIMGYGIWETTGEGDIWLISENSGEVVTITPETSTIKVSDISASDTRFNGSGKTYYNLWFSGVKSGGSFYIYGSNTFNDIKLVDAPNGLKYEALTTQIVSSFTVSGTAGNLITLNSDNEADQFILSKTSGAVNCDYLDISNSNATGGASWYAESHSADTTNNDGWIFTDAPSGPTSVPRNGFTNFQDPGMV